MHFQLYKQYRDEVGTVISTFLLIKKIDNIVSNKQWLQKINSSPLSWMLIRHSLFVTFFITLHRIFETKPESLSVDNLLKYYSENLSIFSKESLKQRKDPENKSPEWLGEYLECAYIPTRNDIDRLRGELKKRRNIFNKIYKPIRNKLIAHRVKLYVDISDEIYAKTNIAQIEEILEFLHALKETLFDLYINGHEPNLINYKIDKKFFNNDFDNLFEHITNKK